MEKSVLNFLEIHHFYEKQVDFLYSGGFRGKKR